MQTDLARWAHAALRIAAGLLFLEHGLQKLFGLLGGMAGAGQAAPLVSQMGVAGILELVGGALIILGLFTRPVAAVLLCEMLYAFATVHAPQGGAPIQNQGELALLYAATFMFLAGAGAGPFSVDAVLPVALKRERRGRIGERRIHAHA